MAVSRRTDSKTEDVCAILGMNLRERVSEMDVEVRFICGSIFD